MKICFALVTTNPFMQFVVSKVHLVSPVSCSVHPPRRSLGSFATYCQRIGGRHRTSAAKRAFVMASAASVLAVVRAASPSCRSPQDSLAFAVHAAVLSSGFRLVAVGDAVGLETISADAPDASVAGWNSSSDEYTFAYVSEEDSSASATVAPVKVLVKALVLGETLLTTLATDSSAAEPKVLELAITDYINTPGSSSSQEAATAAAAGRGSIAKTYKNLYQLSTVLTTALSQLTKPAAVNPASSGSQKKQKTEAAAAEAGGSSTAAPQQQNPEPLQAPDPDHDPLRIGPPRRPLRVGHDDIMPHLGSGMIPGGPPGAPPMGGGMHVGPGHPFFADRLRHPELIPRRGGLPAGPGGVRWDPINPEGLEGWHPDDFQRPRPGRGRGIDPDIGQPGPGRGTDWDNMFG